MQNRCSALNLYAPLKRVIMMYLGFLLEYGRIRSWKTKFFMKVAKT